MSNVTFAPGKRVGQYELLLELASGGTATIGVAVYRGAAGFERLVVVKRLHRHLTKEKDFTTMLLDEARLASSIRHPNVVPVIDVVRAEDEVVLVMEYVESVSLAELVRKAHDTGACLPAAVVSRIAVDVLVGLHEAHEATDMRRQPLGIVHRDVSPQNVIVGVDGVSRVIDFGIAKATSRLSHTRAGVIKGKCAYMSPEQVDGQPVDRRGDIFSAGVVLWEALTGERLFRGEDEFDEMKRVMRAPIPPASGIVPALGEEVDAVLAQALARPVGERFQTALAFARALEQTIPPAPTDAVGEQVEGLCATELEYRHQRLQGILGEELDRIAPRSPSHGHGSKVNTAILVSASASGSAPAPAPALASAPAPAHTLASALTPTPAPALTPSLPPVVRRPLTPILLAVTLVSLLAGAGVATAVLAARPASSPAASTATAIAAPPSVANSPVLPLPVTPPPPSSTSTSPTAPSSAVTLSPPSPLLHAHPRLAPLPRASASSATDLKSNPYEH